MRRGPFTETRFALCEGYEDAALIRGLIGTPSRHLNSFDVSPIPDLADAAGSGGFENAIIGSDAIRGFEKVTSVIIIADNDDDPAKSFAAVRAQLERAKNNGNLQHDWAVPIQAGIKNHRHTVRCHLDVALAWPTKLFGDNLVGTYSEKICERGGLRRRGANLLRC